MSSSSPSSSSSHDPSTLTYAFLGAGNMSSSIIRGMLAKSLVKPSQIRVSSPSGPSAALRALGVFATTRNDECVAGANIIILAVKPFNIGIVLGSCRSSISPDATVISIAAGMKIAQISTVCCVWGGGWHHRVHAYHLILPIHIHCSGLRLIYFISTPSTFLAVWNSVGNGFAILSHFKSHAKYTLCHWLGRYRLLQRAQLKRERCGDSALHFRGRG